ncbi:MAG TPA: rhomboid family intramembrane serine protease [Lacibacter sp.]|nr:rhomboid family intramembrane serine protease [Lacibacter sp.]
MPRYENGNLTITYTIIAINIVVFMIMGLQGAGVFEPNGLVHLRWGSNYGPLTSSGDWWRLFAASFLHFGVFHLLFNMYALFSVAVYIEPLLDKLQYLGIYFCSAVLASVASLYWHNEPVNSAGASGAVFGMYGVFLALLSLKLIPVKTNRSFLLSILLFLLYNLISGIRGGIDLAAHAGGLISGLLIGYLFAFGIKKEIKQATLWMVPAALIVTVLIAGLYLQQNKISAEDRSQLLREIKNDSYPDVEQFHDLYEQFVAVQHDALQIYHEYGDNLSGLSKPAQGEFMLKLEQVNSLADRMLKLNVGDEMKEQAATVKRYVELRKKEMELTIKMSEQPANTDTLNLARNDVKTKIDKELLKLE